RASLSQLPCRSDIEGLIGRAVRSDPKLHGGRQETQVASSLRRSAISVNYTVCQKVYTRSRIRRGAGATSLTTALYLFFELGQLLLQPRGPGRKLLRGRLTGGCLAIGGVELAQIARNALLDLRQTPLQLSLREVIVARVHRLELAAVDRDARFRQQPQLAAQGDKLRTDPFDGGAVVFAEIGDGFVIRNEPSRQPHHFQIAASLTLQPPTRLDSVEIAVDVKLEHRRRMIRRPAGRCRIDAIEPEAAEFQCIDEHIDRAYRIALGDPIIKAFRQQRVLLAIRPLNKTLHQPPAIQQGNHSIDGVFTQSGSKTEVARTIAMSALLR